MEGFDLLGAKYWQPFSYFNLDHYFFNINSETIIFTWITLALLFILLFPIRTIICGKANVLRYLIIEFTRAFINLCTETIGSFQFKHFAFVTSLFVFIFACNALSILPWTHGFMDEPTRDINTTLALGIISFLYIQWQAISVHGLWGYIKEYFDPFFIMLPLNIIGKLASIISISFRLFGNIFGGSTIAAIYLLVIQGKIIGEVFGIISGINLIVMVFFGLFEGFLQAFVFAMLTITYLAIAIQEEVIEEMA